MRRTFLRRHKRLQPSRGTVIPEHMRNYVLARDNGCVGARLGFPGRCSGPLDPDHVRASGGLGMKSPTEAWNLVSLCRYTHHIWKTEHGPEARPVLLDYLDRVESTAL